VKLLAPEAEQEPMSSLDDVTLYSYVGDVRDYTSMHAYMMTEQDPQKVEESSMPVVSISQEQ